MALVDKFSRYVVPLIFFAFLTSVYNVGSDPRQALGVIAGLFVLDGFLSRKYMRHFHVLYEELGRKLEAYAFNAVFNCLLVGCLYLLTYGNHIKDMTPL